VDQPKTPCNTPRGSSNTSSENRPEPTISIALARTAATTAKNPASGQTNYAPNLQIAQANKMATDTAQTCNASLETPPKSSKRQTPPIPETPPAASATTPPCDWSAQTNDAATHSGNNSHSSEGRTYELCNPFRNPGISNSPASCGAYEEAAERSIAIKSP
jgi:hypothetical protein